MDPQIANLLNLGDQMRDAIKVAVRRGAPPPLSALTIAQSYLAVQESLQANITNHGTFPAPPPPPNVLFVPPNPGLVASGEVWEEDFSGVNPLGLSEENASDVGFLAGHAVGPSVMFIRNGAGFTSGKTLAIVSSVNPFASVNSDVAATYPDTRVMANNGLAYIVREIRSTSSFYFFARFRINYMRGFGASARFRIMLYSGDYDNHDGIPYPNLTEHWYRPRFVPHFGMPTTMQASSIFSCVVECQNLFATAYFSYMPSDANPQLSVWGTADRNEVPLVLSDGSTLFTVPYGKWINVGLSINNTGSKPVVRYAIAAPPDPNAKFVRDDATEHIATRQLTEVVATRDMNVAAQPTALWIGIDNLQAPLGFLPYGSPELDIDVDYLQADYQDILHPIVTFPTPPDISTFPILGSARQEYIAYAVRATTMAPGESVVLQFLALTEHDGSYVSPVGDVLQIVGGAHDASPTASAEFVWSGPRTLPSAPDTPSYPLVPFAYADDAFARGSTFSFTLYTSKGAEGSVVVRIGSAEETYSFPSGQVEPYKSISGALDCVDSEASAVEIVNNVNDSVSLGPVVLIAPSTVGDNSYFEGTQQIQTVALPG